ncbi:MAG: Gfo/Idh/MocA family oxidoreductase [Clostridia bacterium]
MEDRIRFGVIGLGMMGREFASVSSRWIHLEDSIPRPEIIGICSASEKSQAWFTKRIPGLTCTTTHYHELLKRKDVDAIYVAVPHNLHEQICIDVLRAGKHLICEKPFGIDKAANEAILQEMKKHPTLLVRCATQMIYFPGAKMVLDWFREEKFGRILQIKAGFKHSSDIDQMKPIGWKRRVETNGAYGVMGDLGPHALLLPLRAGVKIHSVFARLSNIITERMNADGCYVACDTWDNALLLAEASRGEDEFPMALEFARIAPGSPNQWYIEVYGMKASIRYDTENANVVYAAEMNGKDQAWTRHELGYTSVYPTITTGLAAFGFGDALLQMWAAYCDEWQGNVPRESCMTPSETHDCHKVFDGALRAQNERRMVAL